MPELKDGLTEGIKKGLPGLNQHQQNMVRRELETNASLKEFDGTHHWETIDDMSNPRAKSAWAAARKKIPKIFAKSPQQFSKQHKKAIHTAFSTHYRSKNQNTFKQFERVKGRTGPDIVFTRISQNPREFRNQFSEFDGGKMHHTVPTPHIADFARLHTIQQKTKTQADFMTNMAKTAQTFGPTTPLKTGSVHPILGRDGAIPVIPAMNRFAGQMVQQIGEDGDYIHAFAQFNKIKSTLNANSKLSDDFLKGLRKRGVVSPKIQIPKRKRKRKPPSPSLKPTPPKKLQMQNVVGHVGVMPSSPWGNRPPRTVVFAFTRGLCEI